MEISYLCAARHGDVLEKVPGNVMEAHLFTEQNKTGKKQLKSGFLAFVPHFNSREILWTKMENMLSPTLTAKGDGQDA